MIFSNFAYSARNGRCQQPNLFCQHTSQKCPKAHSTYYTNTHQNHQNGDRAAHTCCVPLSDPLPNAESLIRASPPRSYRSMNDTFLSFATPTTRRLHPYRPDPSFEVTSVEHLYIIAPQLQRLTIQAFVEVPRGLAPRERMV